MLPPFPAPAVLVRGARVVDAETGSVGDAEDVLVADGLIQEVGRVRAGSAAVTELDATGAYVFPGLVDMHVHVTAVRRDLEESARLPRSYVTAAAIRAIRASARRGFTTLRDAGGADRGLARAIEDGHLGVAPRLIFGGAALSQTGGHGDAREHGEGGHPPCGIGEVVDGVDEMRRAVRARVAAGAGHVKLMVGGGVVSSSDRLDGLQFSDEEILAAVEETSAAGIYVTAHAHGRAAIARAVALGVRCVEHGSLLDAATARMMAERRTHLVPTLVVQRDLAEAAAEGAVPAYIGEKIRVVAAAGLDALELAMRSGVPVAFGTDLLGESRHRQLEEFAIRSAVQTPAEMLRSATAVPAAFLGIDSGVRPGLAADLVIADLDPTVESLEHLAARRPRVLIGGRMVEGDDW